MNCDYLKKIIKNGTLFENAKLCGYTTIRTGGPVRFLAVMKDIPETLNLIRSLNELGERWFILGNGSNLLVSDEGYDSIAVKFSSESGSVFGKLICDEKNHTINAGAAVLLSNIGRTAMESGLTGFEGLSRIPGTLGGACVMNAGAYGYEIKDLVRSLDIITRNGEFKTVPAEKLTFRYRGSSVMDRGDIVTGACLRFTADDPDLIRERMEDFAARRREKQPLEYPSAGSVFKRPEGYFAGKLIEEAGLKGYRIGDAQVSEKHCGFIVNRGNASSSDVMRLIRHIQKTVFENSTVMLEPELKILGSFQDISD